MTISDKIKNLILDKNLTSTKFADEIDVPRPSISHILSGRNKPSLEIVQKIIKKYPELGLEWFIEEDDIAAQIAAQKPNNQVVTPPRRIGYLQRELNEKKSSEQKFVQQNLDNANFNSFGVLGDTSNTNKSIKKITIFFSDGTFMDINSAN